MQALYKFYSDCGRMGEVEGLFVADSDDVKKLLGKTIYFGEVLGKHSEVMIDIGEDELTQLTTDSDFIKKFLEFGCESGLNPFDYYEEEDEDEDE